MKRVVFFIFAFSICLAQSWAQTNDFEIDSKGVLVKYNGTGGNVVIPNGVTAVGDRAFYNCINLTSVTIPNSVTEIGASAFTFCNKLRNITIPNSVISIGKEAFVMCHGLTSITIPNSVTFIGEGAFFNTSLTTIMVDAGNTSYLSDDNVLYNKSRTTLHTYLAAKRSTSFTIPASVTRIGQSAFGYCTYLTSVTIPNSVTEIGANAFYYCTGLTSITIPNSVAEIGRHAFGDCNSLKVVTVEWATPLSVMDLFYYVNLSTAILLVPTGTKALYEAADVWKDFGMKVEYNPTNTEHVEVLPLKVFASNGILHVSGLQLGKPLNIYSINGQLVHKGIAKSETEQIPVNTQGVYIVVTENQTIKTYCKIN